LAQSGHPACGARSGDIVTKLPSRDIRSPPIDVRFTPESGHGSARPKKVHGVFARDGHAVKALLTSPALLVKIKRDLEN
jgi:hypothetical protein